MFKRVTYVVVALVGICTGGLLSEITRGGGESKFIIHCVYLLGWGFWVLRFC